MEQASRIVSAAVLFAWLAGGLYASEMAGCGPRGWGPWAGERTDLVRPAWIPHPAPGEPIDRWLVVGSFGPERRVRVTNWSPLWIDEIEGAFHCAGEQILIGPFPPYTTVGERTGRLGETPCAEARWRTSSYRSGQRPAGP